MTPEMRTVVDALKGKRLSMHDEKACQEEIAAALKKKNIPFQREVRVEGGVIDFKVGATGVEVKLQGSAAGIRRQVNRYAADDRLDGIVLMTAKPVGITSLMRGKPVHEFDLARAWL